MNKKIIIWVKQNKWVIFIICILLIFVILQQKQISNTKSEIYSLSDNIDQNNRRLDSLENITDGDLENTDHHDWDFNHKNLETHVYYIKDDISRICTKLDIPCNN